MGMAVLVKGRDHKAPRRNGDGFFRPFDFYDLLFQTQCPLEVLWDSLLSKSALTSSEAFADAR